MQKDRYKDDCQLPCESSTSPDISTYCRLFSEQQEELPGLARDLSRKRNFLNCQLSGLAQPLENIKLFQPCWCNFNRIHQLSFLPDYDYLSYRLTNLSCGSVYSFNLVCHNIAGRSKPSATITTPTLGNPPSEVSLDKMISLNSTFITLHLHRWPDGGCPIKYYVIEYKEESQPTWRVVSNNIRYTHQSGRSFIREI